jgi:hypothetical protein
MNKSSRKHERAGGTKINLIPKLAFSFPPYHFYSLFSIGNFYGFIPSGAIDRIVMRGAMLTLSVSQLLARSLGCALTAEAVGKNYVGMMIVSELSLFILYKIVRNDFLYWINNKGIPRFFTSLLARIAAKIIADYTSLLLLRHPNELGGFYFSVNMLVGQVVMWIGIMLHCTKMDEDSANAYEWAVDGSGRCVFSYIVLVFFYSVFLAFLECSSSLLPLTSLFLFFFSSRLSYSSPLLLLL